MSYEVGSSYRFPFTVKDLSGVLTDPVTKVVTVTLPDQTTATPSIVADSTGTFHADYTFAQEGLHKFQAVTTSPVTSKTDYVPVNVFRSVVGVDEARLYIGETDTTRDDVLRHVMAAITEKIEGIVGTCVIRTFTNERQPGSDAMVIRLKNGPLPDENSVTVISSVFPGGPVWNAAQLIVYPDSATVQAADLLPFWWGPWKATYTAGRRVIPVSIQLAAKEAIFDFWANQRPYGVDMMEPGMDATARWEEALVNYDLPPHAKSLLEPYEMPGFA